MESRIAALENKLAVSERRRRLLIVAVAALVVSGIVLWKASPAGAGAQDQIPAQLKARRLVLCDKEGKERAALEMWDATGSVAFTMSDKNGKQHFSVLADDLGAVISLTDKGEKASVTI
ncbi:MAG TPA: hypothetical protein VE981_10825 [Planctomycetota bacterium]|nr:hypothetical protein [Planctomycetota bacterium]